MTAAKVRVFPGWDEKPTQPGYYVECPDSWIGPYADADDADRRAHAANEGPCRHLHTVVPVGLQGVTASGTV